MSAKLPLQALVCASFLAAVQSHAALVVTGGDFGTANTNGQTTPGWFESTTTVQFVEGAWTPPNATTSPPGSGALLLFDGNSASPGWVYQSLGTVSATDAAAGNSLFTLFADFAEKNDGWTNNAVFTVYSGNFSGATGSDIASGGPSQVASFTLTGTQQGLTTVTGNFGRANNQTVGSFDVSSLQGQQLWLRIAEQRIVDPSGNSTSNTGGDLMIDNVRLVPEPGSAMLAGLSVLGLLVRRRR